MTAFHHDSAIKHVTGASVYVNDIQLGDSMLTGKVVFSKYAHADLIHIDISEAIKVEGVVAIILADDIPGQNQMGPVVHDEPCLAKNQVVFIGQAIALIAAVNEKAAHEAEMLIRTAYAPREAVLDLHTAIMNNHLLDPPRKIERGQVEAAFAKARNVLSGTLYTGAQEHWYLETQTALAVPGEDREMKVYASSQNPAETQAIVAEVLGIQKNEVEVEVKRMGGGFGGKETQGNHVAAWAALLAHATRRPVKIHLFRDDDQIMTGKRHRFMSNYKIGFDDAGLIQAYQVELNADAGYATDLSRAILERSMLHADNTYFIPDISITGRLYKTNLPSNTAFRGFGGPQGMAVIENAIDRVARFLHKDPLEIRIRNLYRLDSNDITPYGQKVRNNRLVDMLERLVKSSNYHERRKEIEKFNLENEFYKKGIALTPVKFGISFTTAFLNQASALVNIYTDGTVLVNHGGTEMGQGLHTKIQQIAAAELGVSATFIRVNATNTSKVPNTSPTAASSGTDLNGAAVKNAIDTLKSRLVPVVINELSKKNPGKSYSPERIVFEHDHAFDTDFPHTKITFVQVVKSAHQQQVSMSATGYYYTPGLYFDREKGQGNPFHYFSFGLSVSEVMVDVLTGQHTLLRSDLLQDVGDSINPGIDRGQVEGGFIQGVGWVTSEEMKWDKSGNQLTHSPDTYKIPTIRDIPQVFNVELLPMAPNEGTIRRSKAVGEPPFMLAFSVWLAIKDAISAVDNHEQEPEFSLPATYEVILNAVEKLKNP